MGVPLAERWGRRVLIQPHDIDRAHDWFERHGEAAVFFSRMIPVIRAFISLPAGVAEMPVGTFSLYTLLGSVPWTFGLAAAGFALGNQWTTVRNYMLPVSIAFAVLTVGAVVWWVVVRLRRRGRSSRRPASGEERPQTFCRVTMIPPRKSILLPPGSASPGGMPRNVIDIRNWTLADVFTSSRVLGSNQPVVVPLTCPP